MVTPILTLESIFLHRKVTVKQSFLFKWREPIIGDAESLKQLALPWIMWKAYRIPVVFSCFLKIQKGLQRLCFTTAFREVCSSMKLVKYSFSRCILCIYAANVCLIRCRVSQRIASGEGVMGTYCVYLGEETGLGGAAASMRIKCQQVKVTISVINLPNR